ncbi:MAG TPA: polysaccharide biosynthesis C-terminal domain-containing protein [Puia sp.]
MNWLRSFGNGVTEADRGNIVRGTLYSFVIQGLSIALVFLSGIWIVRSSDPTAYGVYVHVFNWVSILSVIVMGGRDDLVLAQLPKYIGSRQGWKVRQLVVAANKFLVVAAAGVIALFLALIYIFPIRTLSEHRQLFLLASAAVYFSACLALNQMILQALNHIRTSQLVEKIGRPLLLILFVTAFWLLTRPGVLDSSRLVLAAAIVTGVCGFVAVYLVFRKIKRHGQAAPLELPDEKLSGKATWFFFISLLNLLGTKITMLILPWFAPEASIGIFNISYRFADLLIFPFFLMHTVLPQLFARHADTGTAYTQSLFSESNKLMTVLSIPLLLLNIFAGRFFLHWFGPQFETGYTAMLYISLAQFLFSFFGPANTILMMQDREKYSAVCLLVYVAVMIIASRLLIPVAGITGGALAILMSSLVYNLLLAVVTWRLCGIRSPFFAFLVRTRALVKTRQ